MNHDDETKGSGPFIYEVRLNNGDLADIEKMFGGFGFIGRDGVTDSPEDEPTLSQLVYDVFDDMKPSEIKETVAAYFEDVLDEKPPFRAEESDEDEALEMLNAIYLITAAVSSAHKVFVESGLPARLAERMTESLWHLLMDPLGARPGGSL